MPANKIARWRLKSKKEKKLEKEFQKEKEKTAKETKKKAEEEKKERLGTETLESIASSETAEAEAQIKEPEIFELPPAEREFVAPALVQTETAREPRLEDSAQTAPAQITPAPTDGQIYSMNARQGNTSYSSASQYESAARASYEPRRREQEIGRRRFDAREGLIADASQIVPVSAQTAADSFAGGKDRTTFRREDIEKFETELKKYKDKAEDEMLRRKRLR